MRQINKFEKKHGYKPFALITGGSSGMGLEYARLLVKEGCGVLLVSNVQEQLDAAREELVNAAPGAVVYIKYQDLSQKDATDALLAFCDENALTVDILINNAGMFFWKELHYDDKKRIDTMLKLHMRTVALMTLGFGERMKQRGYGYILNVSSMAGLFAFPGIQTYAATKAFNLTFSKALYTEFKPYGVTVSCVCPAAIATPLYGLNTTLLRFGVKIGVIMTPQSLCRKALRRTFQSRRVIRPGFMNIYLPPLVNILSKHLVQFIWKQLQKLL